jgi:hypothetical protein
MPKISTLLITIFFNRYPVIRFTGDAVPVSPDAYLLPPADIG